MGEQLGYIKLHRRLLDNPIVCKDADHLAVWVWLLLKATWTTSEVKFGKETITLLPGQLPPISCSTISEQLGVQRLKVQRVLKCFEDEHMIEQRTNFQSRLISICSWDKYQASEQRNEQRVNSEAKKVNSEMNSDVNTIKEDIRNIKKLRIKESDCNGATGRDGKWTYTDPETGRIRFNINQARKDL